MDILSLIDRETPLFAEDIEANANKIKQIVQSSRFLVLGGAGTIGQAVTKEIFKRNPGKLHVVDLSENNLAELVRDLRSSHGYIDGEFKTFALDIAGEEFDAFFDWDGEYDYILNLSAMKHVRSEKDPFTLMRMIRTNIELTLKTIELCKTKKIKKYFCVSTDKAASPVNLMGASKLIMEMCLMRESGFLDISTARFANVAFSDGSLLHSFHQRFQKQQPIVAPQDVERYFVTPQESGELCLMSCLFGSNRDIYFPKLQQALHLVRFPEIAKRFLASRGFNAVECESEAEARASVKSLSIKGEWPCYFSSSDTTGEKAFEVFFTEEETLDLDGYKNIGVIKKPILSSTQDSNRNLDTFLTEVKELRESKSWSKQALVDLFSFVLPEFSHEEVGKSLDEKM